MEPYATFAEVVEAVAGSWPRAGHIEIARCLGVSNRTVSQWKQAGIPGDWWLAMVELAAARNVDGVTLDVLARLGAKRGVGGGVHAAEDAMPAARANLQSITGE